MTSSRQPSTFFADELQRALKEQSFGIASSYCTASTSLLQATAVITLLEGSAITVGLTARGYHVNGILILCK